ncbi:MAG TPA: NUDIX hydrolase, partial [Rhodobacter sp.]|nr:NUDIX hydrolase [Rhodobacter sp.]
RPVLRLSDPTEQGHEAVWMHPSAALYELAIDADRFMLRVALNITTRP